MDETSDSLPRPWRRRAILGSALSAGAFGFGRPPLSAAEMASIGQCVVPDEAPVTSVFDCTNDAVAFAGITVSLGARADALERGDREGFLATLDVRNPTWRRIQTEYFDSGRSARSSVLRGTPVFLQAKPGGYVRATVDFARTGALPSDRGFWVFSPGPDGIWRHAEPMNEELGPRRLDDRGAFVISYYDWDADVVDRIANVASTAWAKVGAILPLPTAVRPTISLNPTYGSHSGLRGSNTWAAYLPGSRGIVLLRSPDSYGAGTIPVGASPDEKLLIPLAHEMTHLVNDDIVSVVRIPHWMSEGLAEHVADHIRPAELAPIVRAGTTWTLDKASDVIEWGTDPARNYSAADISLAYAHAAHGVRYLIERFGIETFWALASEFASSRMWDQSFQQVTGVTWEAFDTDWNVWLRARVP